jgi:hypothetical protein
MRSSKKFLLRMCGHMTGRWRTISGHRPRSWKAASPRPDRPGPFSSLPGDGGRCARIVGAGQNYCFSHDPERQEERKRNALRGGRARGAGEVRRVKAHLQALADATLSGEVDRGVAAVVNQIWGAYLSALRTALRIKELAEHEERLAELERLAGVAG